MLDAVRRDEKVTEKITEKKGARGCVKKKVREGV